MPLRILQFPPLVLAYLFIVLSSPLIAQEIDLNDLPSTDEYALVRTNPNADTIIIALHGGPSPDLLPGTFKYLETINTYSVVEMLKYEMLVPILVQDNTFTYEKGVAANDTTAALLRKLVNEYTDQGKVVVLTGHSWGAFVIMEYLDDFGIDKVHKFIPMAGRINMNQELVDSLLIGKLGFFEDDGLTLNFSSEWPAPKPMYLLMGTMAGNRWVDSLSHLDLSKMMYIYATADQNVGSLLPDELDFLENGNATIVKILGGDHGAPFINTYQERLIKFIRKDVITSTVVSANRPTFKVYPTLASSQLNISSELSGSISIYNIIGQKMDAINIQKGTTKINVENYPSNSYVINFISDDRKEKSLLRFQIAH